MEKLPNILLICPPIIEGESKNADLLLQLVKKAAEGLYEVKRPGESIVDSLMTASLVIVYLNDESRNPYTSMEIGFRIGIKRAVFLLTHKNTNLLKEGPFDFPQCDLNKPHVSCQLPILSSWDKLRQVDIYEQTITELRSYVEQVLPKMQSAYAVAEMFIDINHGHPAQQRLDNSVFTMASNKTNHIFDLDGSLIGVRIEDAMTSLEQRVQPNQWKYFVAEQDQLLGRVTQGKSNIKARIPFIFKDSENVSEELRGKAFLALITQYTFEKDSLFLRMLYYEVPSPLEKSPSGDHYICKSPIIVPSL